MFFNIRDIESAIVLGAVTANNVTECEGQPRRLTDTEVIETVMLFVKKYKKIEAESEKLTKEKSKAPRAKG